MSEEKQTFAKYLKQFNLKIEDLETESGRGRNTLNQWFYNDKPMIALIIRSALARRFLKDMELASQI